MSLGNGLLAYLPLNETGGLRKDAWSGIDFTDNNTVGSAAGKISNAADFIEANSESLSATVGSAFQYTGSNNLSVSLWFNTDSVTGVNTIFGNWSATASQRSYILYLNGSTLTFAARDNTATPVTKTSIATGTWYHVVLTMNSSNTIEMFVDGVSAGTGTAGSVAGNGTTLRLGNNEGASNFYDGRIDEVVIWSKILSSTEISDLYNSGNARDYLYVAGTVTGTIKFDAATEGPLEAAGSTSTTITHTCTGTDRFLLAAVITLNWTAGAPTSVSATYGGDAMTVVAQNIQVFNTNNWRAHLLRLANPKSGANSLVVSTGSGNGRIGVGAYSYTGVHQTNPIITSNTISQPSGSGGGTMTISLTTSEDGWWFISGGNVDFNWSSFGANTTMVRDVSGYFGAADSNGVISAQTGNAQMQHAGTRGFGGIALAFRPVASAENYSPSGGVAYSGGLTMY